MNVFRKISVTAALSAGILLYAGAGERTELIISAPMLQNFAETSMGITFAVSDLANGFVTYGLTPDLSDGRTVKCGGFRQTGMDDKVIQVRLTGLHPSTKYYYRIGADRIEYKDGHHMRIIGHEEGDRIYSFTTAGPGTVAKFAVINDTHSDMPVFELLTKEIKEMNPSCVIWNGDAITTAETIERQISNYLTPDISIKDYAAEIPYLLNPGNHENRGRANRHLERIWMFRQPEERSSRDWDLGRNYAVRLGDIALIGLDTSEDKMDDDPRFANLFNIAAYREAQTKWLEEVLQRPDIASAKHIVTFCHLPLYDSRKDSNPGDVPYGTEGYTTDYARWQRTCSRMWGPLLEKAGCKVVISGHQHQFRYEAPGPGHNWDQIIGGGHDMKGSRGPTLMEGRLEKDDLVIEVRNALTGKTLGTYRFQPRTMRVLTVRDSQDSLFLRRRCRNIPVKEIGGESYNRLAEGMIATVTSPDQDGVGIAGPQVGEPLRIVAVQRFDKKGEPFEVYPNIRITSVRGEKEYGPEGCLSVPDARGDVARWRDIDITYTSALTKKDTTERVCGFTAVIFQHECDHLDGILYTDKIATKQKPSDNFVLITDVVSDAMLDIRYYGNYNFIGERIRGYEQPVAILSRPAADSLKLVCDDLRRQGYIVRIFDAYRPQRAVDHFMEWATDVNDTRMKDYFYPELDKSVLVPEEYVARRSSHTRGSTVDLTLFDTRTGKEVDMGCTFDYFGTASHPDVLPGQKIGTYKPINKTQYQNRMILRNAMLSHGFKPYDCEWWHFTLADEPFPNSYFDFPVSAESLN